MKDKKRPGQSKKFEAVELQELLDKIPAQTLLELLKMLNITPMAVLKRSHVVSKREADTSRV